MQKQVLNKLGALITLGLFSLALGILHHKLKQYHVHDIVVELSRMKPTALALGVGLVVLDYLTLSLYDLLGLCYIQKRLPFRHVMLGSFVGYVFSNNTTIVGGTAARYRVYSAMGMTAGEVARLVVFCSSTFWLGFFALGAVVFLLVPTDLPVGVFIPFGSIRVLGLLFSALVIGYLVLVLVRRSVRFWGWEFSLPSLRVSAAQFAIASMDWMLTATILYVLLPPGTTIGLTHFLVLFVLAQFVGLISTVPGGLGVFESVMLLLMNGQAEPGALMGSLLLFRFLYYIGPLVLGAVVLGVHEVLPRVAVVRRVGEVMGRWGTAVVPPVLSLTTLMAGTILLFSGALPSAQGRMAWLRDSLPLPAIELSHFLGSVIGATLLILSRGIQRRLDAAYHITVWLLGAGVVMSLAKGLDYEEAVILSLMLLALLPCRKQFYRKAPLLTGAMSPSWIVLVAMMLVATVWLGVFSYKRVEYSEALWWRFAFQADAPRFLRATVGAVGVFFCFGLVRLLRPKMQKSTPLEQAELKRLVPLVQACPQTTAYLALLGDKRFLFNDAHDTFIMYGIEGRSWIAMGDPIGPRENWNELLWDFRELCDQYDGRPVFYQVSAENLDSYIKLGMSFIKLGEEARVDLATFHLEGSDRKDLRYARNKLGKTGHTFEVVAGPQSADMVALLKTISDAWLEEKHTREKGFSLGFFNPAYIAQCPIAVVRQDEKIIAFANVWQGGNREELSVDLMRYVPGSPNEIMDYLFVELLMWGKTQGYQWFNFGMAPLSGLEDHDLAPFWSQAGAFVFRVGEHFYNFQGLRAYKDKYQPTWRPRYLACPRGLGLPQVLTHLVTLISGSLRGAIMK